MRYAGTRRSESSLFTCTLLAEAGDLPDSPNPPVRWAWEQSNAPRLSADLSSVAALGGLMQAAWSLEIIPTFVTRVPLAFSDQMLR